MTESDPHAGGQSPETKAWVARRAAVDRAIAASEERQEKAQAAEQRHQIAQERTGGNPVIFVVGFLLVFGVLALFLWFFIDRVQCDPMITARGSSAACRRAAP